MDKKSAEITAGKEVVMKKIYANIRQNMPKIRYCIFNMIVWITIFDVMALLLTFRFEKDLIILGADITGYAVFAVVYLLLFWLGYLICFLFHLAHKKSEKLYQRILALLYYLLIIPLVSLWSLLLLGCLIPVNSDDKEFDECMEKCVAADKSNIEECAFNYCDPVF